MSKITLVGFGRTINTGNYENTKYYLEAEVGDGDDPNNVLEGLRMKIDLLEDFKKEVEALEKRAQNAELRLRSIYAEFNALGQTLRKTDAKPDAIDSEILF